MGSARAGGIGRLTVSVLVYWGVVGQLFARLADGKFGKEIEAYLPRLFRDRAVRVVENDASDYAAPRPFEHAVATVSTPELDLRIVRGDGMFSVSVSLPGVRRWQALDSLLAGSAGLDWGGLDRALAENWDRLRTSLAAR